VSFPAALWVFAVEDCGLRLIYRFWLRTAVALLAFFDAPARFVAIQIKSGSFCNQVPEQKVYLLPVCFFILLAKAMSIRRRIASEREGLSFCCLAQFSIANLVLGGSRTVRTGSRPVAGRPGLFNVTFSLDGFAMFW
jgi:hypothetical protein